jgi:hypothetical protein
MFWNKKKPDQPISPPPPASSVPASSSVPRGLDAIDVPSAWPHLDKKSMQLVLFMHCTRLGTSGTFALGDSMRVLYQLASRILSHDERKQTQQLVTHYAMEGRTGHAALLPFLRCEAEHGIVSAATIDIAMLMPQANGDPLTGPRFLLGEFESLPGDAPQRGGILAGLMLLGDERLLPLIKGRWREVTSPAARRELAAANSGLVKTLQIDFLLDWLEQTTDDAEIGGIAGTLVRMSFASQVPGVLKTRRSFPASAAPEGEGIVLEHRWTFAEYADIIEPRLQPLMDRESEPKILGTVLEAWRSAEQ